MSSGLGDTLYLPWGASGSWRMRCAKAEDGSAIDLTFATKVEWFLLPSPTTPEASADIHLIVGAGLTVVDALAGIVDAKLAAAQSSSVVPFGPFFTYLKITMADGSVIIPDLLRCPFYNDLDSVLQQQLTGVTIKRLDAATGTLIPITPDMSNYVINRYDLTGLYGGTATKLDGLTAATLLALSNGARIQAGFAGRIVAQYVLRAKAGGEVNTPATGRIVVFVNDATRVAELEFVTKEAVPCTWDEVAQLWCQVTGYGGGASLITPGFTIPA